MANKISYAISELHSSLEAMPYRVVVIILHEILNSLKSYHSVGRVYGALVPSNVFVYPADNYRVELREAIDPILLPDDLSGLSLDDLLGLSPEHFNQNQGLDHRSDLYGLGYIAYYLLTGQANPYGAKTTVDLADKIRQGSLPDPSLVRPGIPEWLSKVVQKLTAPEKAQRYQSVFSLVRQIEAGLSLDPEPTGFSATEELTDVPPEITGQGRKRFSIVKIAALGMILVAVIALVTVLSHRKKNDNSASFEKQFNAQEQDNSIVTDFQPNAGSKHTAYEDETLGIVAAWTDGLNGRDLLALYNLYAEEVHYYGEYLAPDEIKSKQRKLLANYSDFYQTIVSDIASQTTYNGEIRLDFIKRVLHNGKTVDYPSYLIIRSTESGYKIVTESDKITDRILNKSKK